MWSMSMEKVISYLGINRGDGQKKSLDRLRKLLERVGNPQEKLSYVHITGTNGKGSTGSIFQSVLREAGFNVGFFTSPHLEVMNERIRLNDKYIQDEELIEIINRIEPIIIELEQELGEKFYAFELLTTVAFIYFQEKKPDMVILEAGIGGRLDSTNVIAHSELSIITSIGIDHTATLGNSKEEIMYEKVQILKEEGQMVVGPVDSSLQKVALDWANKINGEVFFVEKENIHLHKIKEDSQIFDYKSYKDVKISFLGKHQVENACLVIEGAEILAKKGYPLTKEMVYRGLEKASWPGRFEKVLEKPLFYMDGAHNLASVDRLVETLEELFPKQKFYFVVGMMKDKDYENMLKKVYHLAKSFILISPDPNRGFNTAEVAKFIRAADIHVDEVKDMAELFAYITEKISQDEIVIQFGSLYLVGALKEEQIKIKN